MTNLDKRPCLVDDNAYLLSQFAVQGAPDVFVGSDFATWKFPQSSLADVGRTQRKQYPLCCIRDNSNSHMYRFVGHDQ